MGQDRIEGTVKKAEGATKEQVGKTTDDKSLEAEGKVKQAEGHAQKTIGETKDKAE